MARITILGAGMMGTALAWPLADRGHEVRLVGTWKDAALVGRMKADGVHAKLGLALPPGVTVFSDGELVQALQGAHAVALGVSSAGIHWAAEALAGAYPRGESGEPVPLFFITKGLFFEGGRVRLVPDVVQERLRAAAGDGLHPVAVAGPCIAGELARRVPTCVLVAGRSSAHNETIAELVSGPYYRAIPTTDVVGAEVCAALKNAYAMGIAFAEGMHARRGGAPGSIAMHNLESAVFAQAALEMRHLCRSLGSDGLLAAGLAGVGDLDVTTNGGRTGRFGRLLGQGLTVEQAVERMEGATLECLEILRVADDALSAGGFPGVVRDHCPLLAHLCDVALRGAVAQPPLERFFASGLGA
jgi:glycerol-3-phosphate dehydrogenase (NAD(P)+)